MVFAVKLMAQSLIYRWNKSKGSQKKYKQEAVHIKQKGENKDVSNEQILLLCQQVPINFWQHSLTYCCQDNSELRYTNVSHKKDKSVPGCYWHIH